MAVTCALICEEIRVPVADLQFWSSLVYNYQASPTKGHQDLISPSVRSSSDSLVRYMHKYLAKSHYLALCSLHKPAYTSPAGLMPLCGPVQLSYVLYPYHSRPQVSCRF